MLRLAIALLAAVVTCGTAESADRALVHQRWHRAKIGLPPGLPRPHYNFRTTITYAAPYATRAPVVYVDIPSAPLLPGYYATVYGYNYPGAYYGGPYVPYWDRLPYACGVYGYC